MQLNQHPQSGKRFRICLAGDVQAGYDLTLHGAIFELVDYGDRIHDDMRITEREKQVALMFYAHRCLPNLPVLDPVPQDLVPMQDVLYGRVYSEYESGNLDHLVLLRNDELAPIDD